MKKLKELLNGVNVGKVYGDTDREIGHIHFDSRKIEPGDVFIAQRGVNADGHAFIDKALTRGAVAVVCEQLPENRPEEVTYIWTADTSEALGVMAGNYWDNPSRELKLVGVTGTNGKTTTATLLYELVRLAGEKAGLLSTVCNYIGEEKIPATHTTPDALSIQELLRRMGDAGIVLWKPVRMRSIRKGLPVWISTGLFFPILRTIIWIIIKHSRLISKRRKLFSTVYRPMLLL